MWSIARRLKQTWTRGSLWKRALLLLIVFCVTVQAIVARSLWVESQFRARFKDRGRYVLGPSPLSATMDRQLRQWIGPKRTELFSPIVKLILSDATKPDIAYIAGHRQLRSLEIVRGTLDAAAFQQIASLPELTSLYLDDVVLDSKSLSGLSDAPQLERIKFVGKVTPEALEQLKYCRKIRELHLGEKYFQDLETSSVNGLHLAAVAKIPHLRRLLLAGDNLPDTDLRSLADALELEVLVVRDLRLRSDAINALGKLSHLRQLEISPVYANYPCEVPPLRGFPALSSFSLTGAKLSPAFMTSVAKLPHLQALSLQQCWLDESLPELSRATGLRFLDLNTTDAKLASFQKIGRMDALEALAFPSFEEAPEIRDQCPIAINPVRQKRPEFFLDLEWLRIGELGSGGMGGGFF